MYERIQRVPFQNEKQKELFEYIVDRYDYNIHAIKAESTNARTIRKLMQWSFEIEDYTVVRKAHSFRGGMDSTFIL